MAVAIEGGDVELVWDFALTPLRLLDAFVYRAVTVTFCFILTIAFRHRNARSRARALPPTGLSVANVRAVNQSSPVALSQDLPCSAVDTLT